MHTRENRRLFYFYHRMIIRSLFSSLDHNPIKTFRVIRICNFNEIGIVVPFIGILLRLDEI